MKTLVLTGIGSEQKFNSGEVQSLFYLVFNEGELRLPVPEETAQVLVAFVYGDEPEEEPEAAPQTRAPAAPTPRRPEPESEVTDDDGVDQV